MHCRIIYIGIEIYGNFGSSKYDWTERFSRACLVPLNRSLRRLREVSSLTPSTRDIFHHYHKLRDDVKQGDIKVLQSTYISRSVD